MRRVAWTAVVVVVCVLAGAGLWQDHDAVPPYSLTAMQLPKEGVLPSNVSVGALMQSLR